MTTTIPVAERAGAGLAGEYFPALPIEALRESKWNPRQTYDAVALEELGVSLAQGQLNPCLARPTGATVHVDGREWPVCELAAGHRRYRAAKLKSLPTLATIVRPMTDRQFHEVLQIENLQREDLHPLEEAHGFVALMQKAGYEIPQIADRIGRSVKYVYDRVKLLQLTKEAQELFRAGRFTAGHAILLARLASADQKRALASDRSGNGQIGGLFVHEVADTLFDETDRDDPLKPVSVRELQTWIDDNVRFKPDEVDLPNLFPETATALYQAEREDLKVVKITRDYRVPDEARDPKERTYGEASWKRADGQVEPRRYGGRAGPAKTCEYAVLGVVVAGPGRGDAFRVCVEKKQCKVHWAAEQRQTAARAPRDGGANQKGRDRWQREEAKRQAERDRQEAEATRWEKAAPILLVAAVEQLAAGKVDPAAGELVLKACGPRWGGRPTIPEALIGTSPAALLRQAAYLVLRQDLDSGWSAMQNGPKVLGALGIDARKVVGQVAPKETPKPVQTSAEEDPAGGIKRTGKKQLAGDVRRARAQQKAKATT